MTTANKSCEQRDTGWLISPPWPPWESAVFTPISQMMAFTARWEITWSAQVYTDVRGGAKPGNELGCLRCRQQMSPDQLVFEFTTPNANSK